jgi:WD40 repeat protein
MSEPLGDRVQDLFDQAVALPPERRPAFLETVCAGDPALRAEVESLLACDADFPTCAGGEGLLKSPVVRTPERPEDDDRLDFLAPSQRPDSLGRLGHYEVLEIVGKGATGIVLRAFDEKLHRVVAIKALAPALATTGSSRPRFVREAQAAAAVTHDNIINIHAVEDSGPVPYLVMQYIDGLTLQKKLDRAGPLPLQEVLRIGLQVAAGLAAAHAHGLVHRDVKPANILLENGVERVKLTDFGLARAVDDPSLTRSGLIAGTPAYMSPEQANGEHVDPRSDLFSLGSVLYALCTGHAPFRASTTMAVLKRVCDETPRPVREVNAEVPEWLCGLIAKLHAKSPVERYQSAAEVADLLRRHLAHLQQPGMKPSGPPTPRGGESRPSGRAAYSVRRLAACAALIAVGGVALYWTFLRPDEAKAPNGANGAAREVAPWKPRPPLTSQELARLPSPLDALKREAKHLPENAPPEMVAVLGELPRFPLPGRSVDHWMAQTSDGRLLAVPSGANILLFETRTGTLLRTLTGHTSGACRPAFSPDGKRLASGSGNFILRVWDVATGKEELTLKEHTHWLWAVAYDPGGKRLVSADAGGTIKVWDAQGQRITSFGGHTQGIHHLAFSPDGKRLATASHDGTCKIWDPDTWEEIRALPGNDRLFSSVAWSPDGKLLAAGGDDQVIVWNADTYEVLHTLKNSAGSGLLVFSPDKRTLLTAPHHCAKGERPAFTRWDVKTGERQTTCELPTQSSHIYCDLSRDGRTVFVGEGQPVDARVRTYDAETGQEQFPPPRGHRGAVLSIAVAPDGRTLASGGADRTVRLWDLAGWRHGERLPPVRVLEGHTHEVCSVAFSPDGTLLASGGNDGLLLLWDAASGRKVYDLAGHSPAWSSVTFSPDGRTVAAGGKDGTVNRWDAVTGQPKEPWRWHVGEVQPVAYSPDGRLLASGGKDATVQLLDAVTGQRRHAFRGSSRFTNLAFGPDGRTLAAVNEAPNATLRLWDLETKAERALTGHTNHILGLSFHPGGTLVATASLDGTVQLWGATPPGKEVRTLDVCPGGRAFCAAITPEGRYLAAGLDNGTIAILRVPALPPEYVPAPVAKLPAPADLAKRPAAADALKREDIPEELLKKAGGDKDKAPPELVAVFGEDRHTGGDVRNHLNTVVFSPDGKTLAFGGTDKAVRLITLEETPGRERIWDQRPPEGNVESLAFSPDGKVLACAKGNGAILLWDVTAGAELHPLASPDSGVSQIAFSPNGTLLASAGANQGGGVRLWKVATGQLLFTSRTAGALAAWSVAFSPDGKTLAAGLESGEVWLWDVASGWQVATLSGHGGRVRWIGFHPDGRSLAVAGSWPDHVVHVWDLATRSRRYRLSGHDSEVLSGAWRGDGQLLVTAGAIDGTVRLWDLASPVASAPGGLRSRAMSVIPPNLRWLHGVALSPEGRHLAVCNPNGTVHVLRLAKQGEVVEVPADGEK